MIDLDLYNKILEDYSEAEFGLISKQELKELIDELELMYKNLRDLGFEPV